MRADFFFNIVEFGKTAVGGIGILSALHAAALAIKNFLNAIREFLRPVGIRLINIVEIIQRADAVRWKS